MPPKSYVITALVLAILVAASLPLTLGFAIILWYWLFYSAACVLAVAGSFSIVAGLRAPVWIGVACAAPAIVWAARKLFDLIGNMPDTAYEMFRVVSSLALVVSAAGALRLIETMVGPRRDILIGYAILAASTLLMLAGVLAHHAGWTFTRSAPYAAFARTLGVLALILTYGVFIGASILIAVRWNVERWTAVAISLVSAYLLYEAMRRSFWAMGFGDGDGVMFWLQPIVMLFGAAAVWRIGVVLRSRSPIGIIA